MPKLKKEFIKIKNRRGAALLIALFLIALLSGVVIMSVDRANTDAELSFNQLHEEQAFYIAEAGLERAVVDINKNLAWRSGYYRQVLNGGNYSITVVDSTANAALKDTVMLTSVGRFFETTANLEIWLVPGKMFPYRYAAFGDKSLLIENSACTDSYNSDSGTYAATQDTLGGDVGTNGTALLKNNVVVGGNLSTAEPGGITIENSADILGDTTSTAPVQTIAPVSDSDYAWAQAHNSAPAGFVGTGYTYSSGNFRVENNKTVSLKSGTYYFHNFDLKNHATLNLEPGAQVKIFIIGNIVIENNSAFNSGGVPSQLSIFSKGSNFYIKNDAEFIGTMYSPNVDFVHENNALIYGAVVARKVIIKNNACFHFDRSLSSISYGNDGTMRQIAWRQLE